MSEARTMSNSRHTRRKKTPLLQRFELFERLERFELLYTIFCYAIVAAQKSSSLEVATQKLVT
jgi:hypothetical protein